MVQGGKMSKIVDVIRVWILGVWMWIGCQILGFQWVDIYAPKDEVVGVTFSFSEEYINKISNDK